jgi:hypothetical protein
MWAPTFPNACELKNKVLTALVLSLVLVGTPALAQPPPEGDVAPGIAAEPIEHADEQAEEEHHSVWAGLLWPTVNFAILFGGLWYFLKTPLASYLHDRHTAIRKELVDAATVTSTASAQLAEVERKLSALPGEIEALRHRGAEEIASEETRITALGCQAAQL